MKKLRADSSQYKKLIICQYVWSTLNYNFLSRQAVRRLQTADVHWLEILTSPCGQSKNKPLCDNSHLKAGFEDYGAVGEKGDGLEADGGKLTIKSVPNGPLLLSGNFAIVAGSGRIAWQGKQAALCRCGHSKNRPFCDGSHKQAGFKAD